MNNEFYFANPDELNDPMDCKFNIIHEGDESDWRNWLNRFDYIPLNTKDILFNFMKANGFDEKILFKNSHNFNQLRSSFGICCFSETKESVKMWSHYSESHKGICLGFEPMECGNSKGFLFENLSFDYSTKEIPSNYYPLTKVDYRDEIPEPYNNLKEPPKELFKFVKTKHTHWEEEKEHRLIIDFHIVKGRIFKFHKQHLKEVIFGINTEKSTKDLIVDLVNGLYTGEGNKIEFFEATHLANGYELTFNKL